MSGVATKLQGYIDVTRAPLKPQQRLYVLKQHIIPSMFHQLVLTGSTNKLLKFLDVKIRGAVKQWLKLPKDTPGAFIHSAIDEGGLGVLNLRYMIPLMMKARLEKFVTSRDTVTVAIAGTPFVANMLRRVSVPLQVGENVV